VTFDSSAKQVVDVDWAIPRPRTITEDPEMQTLHDGAWHRRLPDLSATACGSPYHAQFAPVRREQLKHPLCPGCFTPFELARADRAAVEEGE
jgi:hypothetical protein